MESEQKVEMKQEVVFKAMRQAFEQGETNDAITIQKLVEDLIFNMKPTIAD